MQIQHQSLSQAQQDKLQSWLQRDEFSRLVEVVESRIFSAEALAANSLVSANADGVEIPGHIEEAKKHAARAAFLRLMMIELLEIRDTKDKLETTTATPTKLK